ncbi:MAG: OadG family transporter subunit [Terrisporobacter othiniensis]|uniref:OadG family transporter subunit n=1 Tax=Terrisporobacter TaxID=1505652 RepID=UPI0009421FC3|nr:MULTISPECIES: OadG family transporter subunit [Terrisporobacter]MBN9648675.1 OadG family protein [Terrisporobacter glycolicus]MDU4860601.1 OadG family transporter subunit [Terrisporobacter othiniensis]MDU6994460.1 OadG family transporter subunit [Terrisporobacter othiniensis]HBI92740.1 ADP-ribose pyrophosphatase [Terrisporobacter hibernicus]
MQTTFMEGISITVLSMAIVLAILALIALILSSFKFIFKPEQPKAKPVVNKVVEDNDEEKIVAALVTSIIAAEQAQHTNFHVRSIKRVK